jgi:hypothetical protein
MYLFHIGETAKSMLLIYPTVAGMIILGYLISRTPRIVIDEEIISMEIDEP